MRYVFKIQGAETCRIGVDWISLALSFFPFLYYIFFFAYDITGPVVLITTTTTTTIIILVGV